MEIRVPGRVTLADGRVLFAGISRHGSRAVLTAPHYRDHPIDHDTVALHTLPSGAPLQVEQRFDRTNDEPVIVRVAAVPDNTEALNIAYGGQRWQVPLPDETVPRSRLSLMTLFRDDSALLPEFIRYYGGFGVDTFHLYRNGPVAEGDWAFLTALEEELQVRVVLFEWDIPYTDPPTPAGALKASADQHVAQPSAINHHLHLVKSCSDYTMFVDLDEFVFTSRSTVDAFFRSRRPVLTFRCWWASPEQLVPWAAFRPRQDQLLSVARKSEGFGHRTKCLVRTNGVDLMGIHAPVHAVGRAWHTDGLLHFCGFVEHDRRHHVQESRLCMQRTFIRETTGWQGSVARGLDRARHEFRRRVR